MYTIKKATESDWQTISRIYLSCAEWLSSQGWKHWERTRYRYKKENVIQRIKEKDVFILLQEGEGAGTVTLSYEKPWYNKSYSFWENPSSPAVYVGMLAVLPDHHRKGFGSELLLFTEEKAREKRIRYVRFDAIVDYKELNDFYLKRGYKIVGKDTFKNAEGNFYEKSLDLEMRSGEADKKLRESDRGINTLEEIEDETLKQAGKREKARKRTRGPYRKAHM
jgi:GNAT superfamily N-acetyltransferase